MATSVLENCIANLVTSLGNITTANGYEVDVPAGNVVRYEAEGVNPTTTPFVVVVFNGQRLEAESSGRSEWKAAMHLMGVIAHDTEADTRSSDEVAIEFISDLVKAAMADRTRGGYAINTTVLEVMALPVEPAEGVDVIVTVELEIHYRHLLANPYGAA